MDVVQQFLRLFVHNLLPMFLLIGTGFTIQRRFLLDIGSLNKINIYAFVPGLLFTKLMEADIGLSSVGTIFVLYAAGTFLLLGITWLLAIFLGLGPGEAKAAALSGTFANTGNYGIPLMDLVFGANGVAVQSIVLMGNNLLMYTVGLSMVAGQASFRRTMQKILGMPAVYALLLAGVIRGTGTSVPEPLMVYARFLGNGLVPVALVTLGAQLAATKLTVERRPAVLGVAAKLILAPAIMWLVVWLAGSTGLTELSSTAARVLILGAAAPSAVNVVILSMEFKARPDLAAGTIMLTTLLSAVTIPVVLLIMGV